MKDSCEFVARLLPLSQPVFQNPSQPQPWVIKAEIRFAPKEGDESLRHNAGKSCYTQNMNE